MSNTNSGFGPSSNYANPFQQSTQAGAANNAYAPYDVQTNYMPYSVETVPAVVPAVPGAQPRSPTFHAAAAGQAGVNQAPKPAANLPFMSSTAVPAASGNITPAAPGGHVPAVPGAAPGGGTPPPPGPPQRDTQPLLHQGNGSGGGPAQDASSYPFYNIRRYRPYFDVDTYEVLWRVGSSFIGVFRANFMQVTQERPDMYGPFWVATTLIFVTAVAGNYANYIEWKRVMNTSPPPPAPLEPGAFILPPPPPPADGSAAIPQVLQDQWFTDYTKLAESAGIFYGYVFVLSFLLWLVLRYLRSDMRLINMFCVYGYAMTIYIPISLVCIIPSDVMRWAVVMGGTATSGLFLLANLRERIMVAGAGKSVPMLLIVLGLHVGLGLLLKLYFFSY